MLPMLLLSNLKLVIYLFGALVFSAMSWLYFDALSTRRQNTILLRAVGAMVVAVSYLFSAVVVDGVQIGWLVGLSSTIEYLRGVGYLVLVFGVWSEPLSKRPSVAMLVGSIVNFIVPVLPGIVGLGYLRRASVGLERHLSRMAYGMYIISIAEVLDLRRLLTNSSDIRIYEIVRDFGPIWILQLVVLLFGYVVISRWVFGYLLRRFETQITLFMGMLVMAVFAVATMVFTYVMSNQLEQGAQRQTLAAVSMIKSNWGRVGDELTRVGQTYVNIMTDNKEELAQKLVNSELTIRILDKDKRDILTGELSTATGKWVDGAVGYQVIGEGGGKKIVLSAILARESGWVVVSQEIAGAQLEKAASEVAMAVRLYEDRVVIGTSSVPGYPEIASPLLLTETSSGKLGGVSYTSSSLPLSNTEGVEVARLVAAQPIAILWQSVGVALLWTYLSGVVILLLMEIPAVVIARYLTRQLG